MGTDHPAAKWGALALPELGRSPGGPTRFYHRLRPGEGPRSPPRRPLRWCVLTAITPAGVAPRVQDRAHRKQTSCPRQDAPSRRRARMGSSKPLRRAMCTQRTHVHPLRVGAIAATGGAPACSGATRWCGVGSRSGTIGSKIWRLTPPSLREVRCNCIFANSSPAATSG
jgi:hypothetical protein